MSIDQAGFHGPGRRDRAGPTIVALNAVSGLAHLAQFGLLYPLFALWLDARGMPTWQVGLVGSAAWAGMLVGNLFAPRWMQRIGASARRRSPLWPAWAPPPPPASAR